MTAATRTGVLTSTFRSMASDVELRVVDPAPEAELALERAAAAIRSVATHLTRFEPTSALSQANARPSSWHLVPPELADAVQEAERAHRVTGGLFDPRVLDTLLAWGYDRTFDEVAAASQAATALPGWSGRTLGRHGSRATGRADGSSGPFLPDQPGTAAASREVAATSSNVRSYPHASRVPSTRGSNSPPVTR